MVSAIFWQLQNQLQIHQMLGVYKSTLIKVQSYRNITNVRHQKMCSNACLKQPYDVNHKNVTTIE